MNSSSRCLMGLALFAFVVVVLSFDLTADGGIRGVVTEEELTSGEETLGAESGVGSTKGIIDILDEARSAGVEQLVGETGYYLVPETDGECLWTFADGVLTASTGWDSVVSRDAYRDFRLHVEFNVNEVLDVGRQANGNSGVYMQQRYEVQILNSYGVSAEEYESTDCGGIYGVKKPDKLVSKPAGEWQAYDIVFRSARYAGDAKIANARMTVYHNGVLIHDDVAIAGHTTSGVEEGPAPGPIRLQGHRNKVRFRNVWVDVLDLDR